jgi:Tol biopolymer transport system component
VTKRMWTGFAAVLLTVAPLVAQKPEAAESLLQTAVKREVVDGNLAGAIEGYKKALAAAKGNRSVAAKALIGMAECYQKLGDAQSRAIYDRVIRDYADQKEAVAAARAGLGVKVASNIGGNTRQVWTKLGGSPYGPVSRDGRYVAFTSYAGPGRRGSQNLAVHDLITGADLVLTQNESPVERPGMSVFSPDSRQIGYTWIVQGVSEELRIMELNGNSPAKSRVLFKTDDRFRAQDWSLDGKWIAVGIRRKDHIVQLGLVSTSDGTLRVLKSIDWAGSTKVYFSPDSRYLAYDLPSSENSEKRDIFVIAVDGSREVPAVIHPANDRLAGWTPGGKHLLFISDRNGRPALWSLPFESGRPQGNPVMLRPDFGANHDDYLGATRTGELYFSVLGGGVRVSIGSVDLGSGKSNPATMQQFTNGIYPAWSGDGKYLAYMSYQDGGGTFLSIYSAETGRTRELRPNLTYPAWPSWSPDGRSLLVPAGDAKGRWGIFRIDAQTADVEPIAISGPEEAGFQTPQWLPDGKGIVYGRGRKQGGDGAIVKRELSSGKESEIVRVKLLPNQTVYTRGFVVSPDGHSLAYLTSDGTTAHTAIMLMPLAGGQPRELVKISGSVYLGGWTPDNQSLLYSRNAGEGRTEALLLPINGSQPRNLDLGESFATELQMHPDGKRVAFWSNNQTAEQFWVLENFLHPLTAKK